MLSFLDPATIGTIFSVLAPVAGAIYTWFATQRAAARKEIDTLTKRLDAAELQLTAAATNASSLSSIGQALSLHDKRITAVESDLKHLPNKEDMHALQLAMTKLEGTVSTLAERVSGVDRTAVRIDTFLRREDAGQGASP